MKMPAQTPERAGGGSSYFSREACAGKDEGRLLTALSFARRRRSWSTLRWLNAGRGSASLQRIGIHQLQVVPQRSIKSPALDRRLVLRCREVRLEVRARDLPAA